MHLQPRQALNTAEVLARLTQIIMLMAYLPRSLLPDTTCPSFNRKFKGTPKARKTYPEEMGNPSKPDLHMTGIMGNLK